MNTQVWEIRNRKRNRPKRHLVTGVWQYGGFSLEFKIGFVSGKFGQSESFG
ncbi:hypothetical protein [Flavobacterium psychrophilum]|uniref:hypothetical protein n=1 Tax=Flavobacterium psychrophilum TaxID=96345 RepID=UPI000AD598FF|nr:hypothetical protein [Flavobacterium psychrophilum]EKT3958354.1 hypothetical protein [Flavobacterium psychrophilum]EKT4510664.1 hypothetical protein [Flavobacterium psychrophilum]